MMSYMQNRSRWYRSPNGPLFGVITGLAEWRQLDSSKLRWIVAIIIICTGIFPGGLIYLLLALILPMAPDSPGKDEHFDPFSERMKEKEQRWDEKFRN